MNIDSTVHRTILQMLEYANETQLTLPVIMLTNLEEMKAKALVLQRDIAALHSTLSKCITVYNSLNASITSVCGLPRQINIRGDTLRANSLLGAASNTAFVTSGIPLPCKVVRGLSELPMIHLYYVESIRQFALNINGVVIRGNIGDVHNKHTVNKNRAECPSGVQCPSLLAGVACSFWHDPIHLSSLPRRVSALLDKRRVFDPIVRIRGRQTLQSDLDDVRLRYSQHASRLNRERDVCMHILLRWLVLAGSKD